ncbi:MAG: hypothetical protein LBQ31_02525 [Bacteroidales bacterium]|jgi:hypothetical protein|nr:hypothetical protein [Bacteroidales bacterium]
MKHKIIYYALLLVAMTFAATQLATAQNYEKKLEKQQQKAKYEAQKDAMKKRAGQYKNKIKEYEKDGWKLASDSRTIEVALLEHYEKLTDKNNKQLVGEVSQCKSINICRQSAMNNAQNSYASMASADIKGRIESLLRADANVPETEIDKMLGGYERLVSADVSGALSPSYSVIKDNGDGTKSFQTIFLVNETEASKIRLRAMEKSLLETKITVKEAEEISKFVNEGFETEQ